MAKTVRNVAIILVLAGLVAFLPGGEAMARTVIALIGMGFLSGLAYLAYRLYRDQQLLLDSLGDGRRALLYGSVGLIALLIGGYSSFAGTAGFVVWVLLLLGAGLAIFAIVREANRY